MDTSPTWRRLPEEVEESEEALAEDAEGVAELDVADSEVEEEKEEEEEEEEEAVTAAATAEAEVEAVSEDEELPEDAETEERSWPVPGFL